MSDSPGANGAGLQTPTVVVVRDPPRDQRISMERYADQVEAAIGADTDWTASPITSRRLPHNWFSRQADNLIGFPQAVARSHGSVYHVIDHSYAHVVRGLPADRTVVTCHDLMPIRSAMGDAGPKGDQKTVIRFRWTVSHLKRASRVICVTHATARDAVDLAGVDPDRIVVIGNGVDPAFRPLPAPRRATLRRAMQLNERFVVLNVSTGSPYKNLEGVLRTLKATRDTGLDAVLLRTGRPLPIGMRELADQLGLLDCIIERGFIPQQELAETYGLADALLHPSYWEGFGWPPLEAMACGLPIVTSTTPALLEVAGGVGFHADPDDHGALANAMVGLTSQATVAHQRSLGLARAAQFSIESSNRALLDVYTDVLGRASRHRS